MVNLALVKIALCLGYLVNGAAFTITFPFGSMLVQKFGMADDRSSTGYWVGILAFSMMAARALFSPIWGLICDRWGRRVSAVFGIIAMIVFSILFGLSSSYWMALVTRFLLGALCCVVMVSNAIMVEVSKSDPGAMGWLIIGWQSGHILGNVIGGVLADPYGTGLSDWDVFEKYPFLLPNIVISLVGVVSLIFFILFVPETYEKSNLRTIQSRGYSELFKDEKVMLNLLLIFLWVSVGIGFDEIMPLFCWADKKDGGLGMNTTEIGSILGVSVILLLFVELPVYKLIRNYMNIVRITRYTTAMASLIVFAIPVISVFRENKIASYIIVTSFSFTWWLLNFITTTNVLNMQNNCVINSERGKMNGIYTSVISVAKAIIPLSLGSIFASTTKNSLSYPFNYAFTFNLMGILSLLAFLLSFNKKLENLHKPLWETSEEEPLVNKE